MTFLKKLDVSHNRLTGWLPAQLGNLTRLQLLSARHNSIGGSVPAALFGRAWHDGTAEAAPHFGAAHPALKFLLLDNNVLVGTVPSQIGQLSELSQLHASTNSLEGPLPTQLGSLVMLETISLASNRVNGSIPTQIGRLKALRHLDVYDNQMSGDVPATIEGLTNLKTLHLDNQHLKPVRQHYCGQRIPNTGRHNWRLLRDEYLHWTATVCPDSHLHDTDFSFNNLQSSKSWEATA